MNSGYDTYLGAVSRPTIDAVNPLILHAWDGASSPFWINSAGSANFSGTVTASNVVGGLVSSGASPTFGDSGYQMGDFGGTKKFYVGDGANKSISFDGTNFSVGADTEIGSTVDTSVTVHQTTGDYASISAALEGLSKLYKGYKYGGVQAKILIKSGYVESVGIDAKDVNLGWITIQGDTGVTSYDIVSGFSAGYYVYSFERCSAPLWTILPSDIDTTYKTVPLFRLKGSRVEVRGTVVDPITSTIVRPFLSLSDATAIINGYIDITVGGYFCVAAHSSVYANDVIVRSPSPSINTTSGSFYIGFKSSLYTQFVEMYNSSSIEADFFIEGGSSARIKATKPGGVSKGYIDVVDSTVDIDSFSSTGSYTSYGLRCSSSNVSVHVSNLRRIVSDETHNISCLDGSTIRTRGVVGGTNITKNSTASLSNGMIIGT